MGLMLRQFQADLRWQPCGCSSLRSGSGLGFADERCKDQPGAEGEKRTTSATATEVRTKRVVWAEERAGLMLRQSKAYASKSSKARRAGWWFRG